MTLGLETRALAKSYGGRPAVRDVSLVVPNGALACFLGPSGCGKTSLLRMIAGLEMPDSGQILMDGRDITTRPAHQRNFSMVFQDLALFPFLSVEDNIGYSLKLRNVSRRARAAQVRELLELIKLPDIGMRRIDQLSGGERQRVAIARALAQEPLLFLLDEPLSALDAKMREHMQVELRQLQRKLHVTTVLVTHDQREAMAMADLIVVMADGCVQQAGPPAEIYRAPANRFVAGFIGRCNFLSGIVADANHVRLGDRLIEVVAMPQDKRRGEAVITAIRPEQLALCVDDKAANSLCGRLVFARDMGDQVEYCLDWEGQEILGIAPAKDWALVSNRADSGSAMAVAMPAEACRIMAD